MELLILAAGKSQRIYSEIKKPKCLLEVNKKTLIEKIILDAKNVGLKRISVVLGFKSDLIKNKLKRKNINFIYNRFFKSRDMLYSFILGLKNSKSDVIFVYSDIFFSKKILKELSKKSKATIPVNIEWKKVWSMRKKIFMLDCETLKIKNDKIIEIGKKPKNLSEIQAQYMGIGLLPKSLIGDILKFYDKIKNNKKMQITEFLQLLIEKIKLDLNIIRCKGGWYEFDDIGDYKNFKYNRINRIKID